MLLQKTTRNRGGFRLKGGEDDTTPPMCAAYILFPVVDAVKRRLLFIFLPRKEKDEDVTCKFLGTWCVLCLKESG